MGRLESVFRDVVGESGSVSHLVPTVDVEIMDIDPTVEEEEVAEAVWSCIQEDLFSGIKVSLTRKPFRGTK